MLRILLADDHKVVRNWLRTTLQKYDEWHVCGEACDGRQAVELALQLRPDIIVMDISMPRMNGLEATRLIKSALPQVEVLVVTLHDSREMVHGAFDAGASGLISKSTDETDLVQAIEAISRHEQFVRAVA
jgi:DNA-binding NarL/FixJ family response regulator